MITLTNEGSLLNTPTLLVVLGCLVYVVQRWMSE